MFEFSRELKRLFSTDGPRDGLTAGHAPLLELLDLNLLRGKARSADIAAGRISAKDPSQRSLEAARVWRELSRRTGDAVALRKAAAAAERAADGFSRDGRTRAWAQARCEQAVIAMTGAELFGDEGLAAAARYALDDVATKASGSAAAALAQGRLARLDAGPVLRSGDAVAALGSAAVFDAPIAALESGLRNRTAAKADIIELRCDRAELLLAAGSRLRDTLLLQQALDQAEAMVGRLDATYEPISWVRAQELRAAALVALGEAQGDITLITDGVTALADALDLVGSHHSPMDWARLQHALALALRALGEASDSDRAFDQALGCFDRALWALKSQPAVSLRAAAANNRAACMARRAELTGDLVALDAAADALKLELAAQSPGRDPIVWAVSQVNLARLYETRMMIRGPLRGEVEATATALTSALDVFGEFGMRSLSDEAARALDRLAALGRAET